MARLQDKVAVVTGAGNGIGRSAVTAAVTAHSIVEAGGQAISLAVDVGDAGHVQRMIETAHAGLTHRSAGRAHDRR